MKKFAILFVMSIISISSFASATPLKYSDSESSIAVEINPFDKQFATLLFSFEMAEDFYAFKIEDKVSEMLEEQLTGDSYTESVTATLRNSYVVAYSTESFSVNDVACGDIASTSKRLKGLLKKVFK